MSYYMKLSRIEFVITNTCSGRCKHCSCGERPDDDGINVDLAVDAVKKLSKRFSIESVMTFGGEPLLFADTVAKIHAAARDCGILNRQIITNGFFATDGGETDKVAKLLCDSGINDILLSIDAFHQEFIPLDPVVQFAEALLSYGVPSLQVHPAWVVNEAADNHYNAETKRLLKIFADKGINATEGNNIFPSGNALKYLAEFFPPPGKVDLSAPCGS
ncbi:MAG: radical SAM protein, partial [Defluviitaleaceae bacterium]|nr:radical SAM protein [Defluviitaleaceae bacterium]